MGSDPGRAEDATFLSEAESGGEPRSPLNLRQIEVFRAIMVAGSASAAGRMLHVSQPAISRVLALSESRLGFKLFERRRTRLVPTPEAQRLFEEVQGLYCGMQRVNDLATNLARSGVGSLRVVTSASFAQRLVPAALQRLARGNPGVQIDCRNVTYDELAARFVTADADIGISMLAPDHANLTSLELGQDELVCVLPRTHPLASKQVLTLEALRSTPWIGYPTAAPLGQIVSGLLGAAAASAQVVVHSPVTAIAFAQQGLGAALVVRWSLPPALAPGVVVRPIEPAAPVKIWAVHSNLAPLPVLAKRFLAAVGKVLADRPPGGRRGAAAPP